MTEQEKKLQRARLIVDLEDAEGEFAHLRESAIRESEALEAIQKKIRRNATLEPTSSDFMAESDLKNRLTPEEITELRNVDSTVLLVEELKQARQKVFHLRERRAQLARAAG